MIDPEPVKDERGMFARTWCRKEFEARGLKATWVQNNLSVNIQQGTLRGMHYQIAPHEEAKLVQCMKGTIYDVIVDLRPASSTYCHYYSVVLSAENLPEQQSRMKVVSFLWPQPLDESKGNGSDHQTQHVPPVL